MMMAVPKEISFSASRPFPQRLSWWLSLGLLAVVWLVPPTTAHVTNAGWYQRYDEYPPYCSIPEEMKRRVIPPRMKRRDEGETRLKHVTALIRHGARTPYANDIPCWDGFWESPETGVWDCDLTSYYSPPTPQEIEDDEGKREPKGGGSDAMFLFEKRYDALKDPLRNDLNGTCKVGQLILQGYDQELHNGEMLRVAYGYDSKKMDHDRSMRLLDLDLDSKTYLAPSLWYRVDDDERTLLSGQILLRGLFGTEFVQHLEKHGEHPIVPLHTADRDRDILAPQHKICPRLDEISDKVKESAEYKEFMESSQPLRDFMRDELGSEDVQLDCLMTTMCTDRALPNAINDYGSFRRDKERKLTTGGSRNSHFQRIADYVSQRRRRRSRGTCMDCFVNRSFLG